MWKLNMELQYIIYIAPAILIVLLYVVWNLLRKVERLEDEIEKSDKQIESIYSKISESYQKMKDADRLGSFESDDESGFIWNQIKSILDDLKNEYNIDA